MDLSIIIVNYKSREKLSNCLVSLEAANLRLSREILVIDNNSGDDLTELASSYSTVRLIVSSVNQGMGGGNNIGIEQAQGKYILILNPDTVVQPGAIETLVVYLESHPEVAMVGPKLLYPNGSLQYSCSSWPRFWMPVLRRTFLGRFFPATLRSFMMKDYDHSTPRTVDWLMGSCLLFRRELPVTGGVFQPRFDERYFMYFEDTDLARQVWSQGYAVVYVPQAIVIHDHQRASAQHPWYLAIFLDRLARQHILSWLRYFIKWGIKRKIKV